MRLSEEKLQTVGLDSLSIRIHASKRIEYIHEETGAWKKELEPQEKYLIPTHIGIYGMNLETDEEKEIGVIRAYFFEPEILIEDSSFWEVCDAESGDLEAMAEAITDEGLRISEEICSENASIFYIDEIFIDKEYRNLDIGSYVIQNLDEFLFFSSNLNIGTIVTMPYAMEGSIEEGYTGIENEKEKNKTLKGLIRFFKRNGFEQVGVSNYYYKKILDTM